MEAVFRFIATGAYTGYAPFAPGTFGTLPGVALALALAPLSNGAYVLVVAVAIAVAMWASDRFAAARGVKDPSIVVADEIVGYLVATAFLPLTPATVVASFLAFRFFDITKPPPARQAESLAGGVGIVADDLVAGLYANLVLRLAILAGLPLV